MPCQDLENDFSFYFDAQGTGALRALNDDFEKHFDDFTWVRAFTQSPSFARALAGAHEGIREPMTDMLGGQYASGFAEAFNELGQEGADALAAGRQAAAAHRPFVLSRIDQTSGTRAQRALDLALAEEDVTRTSLRKALRGAFNHFTVTRSKWVAFNECNRAREFGKYLGAKQVEAAQNMTIEKLWVTRMDGRVDDPCVRNEGQGWIPLDQTFQSGDLAPPEHINCRCTTRYRKRQGGVG